MRAAFESSQERRSQFAALVIARRHALGELYAEKIPVTEMRKRKAAMFDALAQDYAGLKQSWGGYAGYDRFFDEPNNAKLASISFYNRLVPEFLALLHKLNDDLPAFYAEVKRLAQLSKSARYRELGALSPDAEESL